MAGLSKTNLIKESLERKTKLNKDLVKEFMKHVMAELELDNLPPIKLSDNSQEAIDMRSWGGYQPSDKSIHIVIAKRHPADVFRTLAHELVHYKQDTERRLKPGSGATGSKDENEANSRAAVIMRNFAQAKPNLFEHLVNEVDFGINNALPFKYVGGSYNNYTFSTPKFDYVVSFIPDKRNKGNYDRIYKTRIGFKETKENIPLTINSTVMAITLDFLKNHPDLKSLNILPKENSRFNIVKQYVNNNLPNNYTPYFDETKSEIIIKPKE